MPRFRDGLRVGRHEHALGQAAITLGLAAVGGIRIHRAATLRLTRPPNVAEQTPGATIENERLWTYDAPTGGFPVLPVDSRAESPE